jgi:hypothetical protein
MHTQALGAMVNQSPQLQSHCVAPWHGSWLMCPVAQASEQKCLFPRMTAVASSTLHVHGGQSHRTRIAVTGISEIELFWSMPAAYSLKSVITVIKDSVSGLFLGIPSRVNFFLF